MPPSATKYVETKLQRRHHSTVGSDTAARLGIADDVVLRCSPPVIPGSAPEGRQWPT